MKDFLLRAIPFVLSIATIIFSSTLINGWTYFGNSEKREKIILIISILTLFVATFKECNSDNEKDKKELQAIIDAKNAKLETQKRDSVLALKYSQQLDSTAKSYNYQLDTSTTKTINTFVDRLAKFGLHVDSANNKIIKSVDTSGNIPAPNFDFCVDGVTFQSLSNDTLYCRINFCADDASAFNVRTKVYLANLINNELVFIPQANLMFPHGQNLLKSIGFGFDATFNAKNVSQIYILLIGTCTDGKGKTYFINTIHNYDIKEKKFGLPVGDSYKFVEDFFTKQGVIKG